MTFHPVLDAIHPAARPPMGSAELIGWYRDALVEHDAYLRDQLQHRPEIRDWTAAR